MNCFMIGFNLIYEITNAQKLFEYFEYLIKNYKITNFICFSDETYDGSIYYLFKDLKEKYPNLIFCKLNILTYFEDYFISSTYNTFIHLSDYCLICNTEFDINTKLYIVDIIKQINIATSLAKELKKTILKFPTEYVKLKDD